MLRAFARWYGTMEPAPVFARYGKGLGRYSTFDAPAHTVDVFNSHASTSKVPSRWRGRWSITATSWRTARTRCGWSRAMVIGAHGRGFTLNVTVGRGAYDARLKFAETQCDSAGQRGISISAAARDAMVQTIEITPGWGGEGAVPKAVH